MDTITTKQLRENMPEVIRTLREGRPVRLTYRRKPIGTIEPQQGKGKPLSRGSPEAILHFLEHNKIDIPPEVRNSKKSIKEEIAEMRDRDLGVKY